MDKGLKQAFHKGENPNDCFHPTWIPEKRCSLLEGRKGKRQEERNDCCAWQIMPTNPACSHLQAFPYPVSSSLFPSPLYLAAIRPSRLSSEALFSQKPQPVPLLRAAHPQQSGSHGRVPLCSPPHRPTFFPSTEIWPLHYRLPGWGLVLTVRAGHGRTKNALEGPPQTGDRDGGLEGLFFPWVPPFSGLQEGEAGKEMSLPLSWNSARSHSVLTYLSPLQRSE